MREYSTWKAGLVLPGPRSMEPLGSCVHRGWPLDVMIGSQIYFQGGRNDSADPLLTRLTATSRFLLAAWARRGGAPSLPCRHSTADVLIAAIVSAVNHTIAGFSHLLVQGAGPAKASFPLPSLRQKQVNSLLPRAPQRPLYLSQTRGKAPSNTRTMAYAGQPALHCAAFF